MVAFAANSLLCRMALGQQLIDAASFTSVRILAGAATLAVLAMPRLRKAGVFPNWRGILALSCYMVCFSFAYLTLSAGTGALLLFGAVQLTMLTAALRSGERFSFWSWTGLMAAIAGLTYLLAPGVKAPDPFGALLMVIAGVAWGFYSLIGRNASDPLMATASNFIFSIPLAFCLSLIFVADFSVSPAGVVLAAASGALASGVGYAIWYAALANLTAGLAATLQLSVPVIAAIGGVALLSEQVTYRLVVASCLTLGGIWLVVVKRAR